MNLQQLKDIFFIGSSEEIDYFMQEQQFKPRCIQPSTQMIDGVNHRILFNSENDTYIDQEMVVYKEDSFSHRIVPLDHFVTIFIERSARHREEGRRNFINTITISREALSSGRWFVPVYTIANSLPERFRGADSAHHGELSESDFAEDDLLKPIVDDTGNQAYIYTEDIDRYASKIRIEDNVYYVLSTTSVPPYSYMREGVTLFVRPWNFITSRFDEYMVAISRLTQVFTQSCNSKWCYTTDLTAEHNVHQCSECSRYYIGNSCPFCNDFEVYPYHGWRGETTFLKADNDSEDEKLFFGMEIETSSSNKPENRLLVRPYRDMFHLERDGSLPGNTSFEIISQPMTWNYLLQRKDDITAMCSSLMNAGQRSHETNGACGLHIHVNAAAFKDEDAIQRALALVHGFRTEMEKFARRKSAGYYRYSTVSNTFSKGEINNISSSGHGCAVNLENHRTASYRHGGKDTVEFRIFRGTLQANTIYATLQFVKNIVAIANDPTKIIVKFGDLLQGNFIDTYVANRREYGVEFDTEQKMSFINFTIGEQIEEFLTGQMSCDSFITVINGLQSQSMPTQALAGGAA